MTTKLIPFIPKKLQNDVFSLVVGFVFDFLFLMKFHPYSKKEKEKKKELLGVAIYDAHFWAKS